ncbi:MAG: TrmH family RNA methyltransferase, partial [Thermoanaerobaculia bacterium]
MANKISVILVSPKYGGNVGASIRLLANFGIEELLIVDPRVDLKSEEVKSLSVDAEKFVKIKIYENLKEAVKNFSIIFAT